MYILGISAYYHDAAAVLIKDGNIIIAIEEEKLTRIKHDFNFPTNAIKKCLEFERIDLSEIQAIVFYDKPLVKFDRIMETFLQIAPKGFKLFLKSIPMWIKDKIFLKKVMRDELKKFINSTDHIPPIFFSEHHLSHAASAYYPSGFSNALIICIDGVGEWATTSAWEAKQNIISPIKEIHFPHSLGLFYSAFTYYLGFKVNSGEYKMMGLAPYGEDLYSKLILDHLLIQFEDGSFQINMDYFNFLHEERMTGEKLESFFNQKRRLAEETIEKFHKDLAKSVQVALETVLINMIKKIYAEFPNENLCLSGGVALNCVANGKIKELNLFKNIWVQPAAGDAGGALGAALAYYHLHLNQQLKTENSDQQVPSHLGMSFSPEEILKVLKDYKASFEISKSREERDKKIALLLDQQKVIGIFQGRMEFGPRALGARSIIGDPRNPKMQSIMNLKIKKRESFRPFAPAILIEDVHEYFDWEISKSSPYMLFTVKTKKANLLSATTHVDQSARIQTVCKKENPDFYNLINEFKKVSGCPVVINTSFNVRGEPIVSSPYDAIKCFLTTDMDILVLEDFILSKDSQKEIFQFNWESSYAND